MMFSGDALMALVVSGIAGLLVVGIFGPPALVAGLAWLVAPRFGFEVDFLPWYGWSIAVWVPLFLLWIKFSR